MPGSCTSSPRSPARCAPGYDALHALQACLNIGTLSGAPKIRATQLLRERRDAPSAAPMAARSAGWPATGMMDSGVVIRIGGGQGRHRLSSAPAPASSTTATRCARPTRRGARPRRSSPRSPAAPERRHDAATSCCIDNLDSFTFNLVDAIQRLGATVAGAAQHRLGQGGARRAPRTAARSILISPGPGPAARIRAASSNWSRCAKGRVPLAGVCLGQQAILMEAGGAARTRGRAGPRQGQPARP